ncbi:hypothetical protein CLU79DRAFT_842909 [Phycomyces nitens]|nr:hypothetical protein CLU79DRAFT_842909 [Phycomyces nitens]
MHIHCLVTALAITATFLVQAVPLPAKAYSQSLHRRSGVTVKSSPHIHQEFTTTDTSTEPSDKSTKGEGHGVNVTTVSSPVIHQETISIDTNTNTTTKTTSDTTVSSPVTVTKTEDGPEDGAKEGPKEHTKRSDHHIKTTPKIDESSTSVDTSIGSKDNANPASVTIYNCPGAREVLITSHAYPPANQPSRPRSNGPSVNPAESHDLDSPQSVTHSASPDT